MSLTSSYFALPNPFTYFDSLFNPFRYQASIMLRDQPLAIGWTQRAEKAMNARGTQLRVELQLYFSCVVKKRVLFEAVEESLEWITVNDRMQIAFRAVQSNACDPVEFAANFPVKQEYTTIAAEKMHPSSLQIDFRRGKWWGEFGI